MRRKGLVSLVVTVVVTLAMGLFVLIAGYRPLLGLDLQGGVSVVLQPVERGEIVTDVPDEQIEQAIEIIRNRVDAIGVAEPEITSQGSTILVQLPGIEDREEALEVVGQTAELRFRPVLSATQAAGVEPLTEDDEARLLELRTQLGLPDGVTAQAVAQEESQLDQTPVPGDITAPTVTTTTTTTVPPTVAPESTPNAAQAGPTTAAPATTTTAPAAEGAGGEEGLGGGQGRGSARPAAPSTDDDGTTTTTEPEDEEPAEPPRNQYGIDVESDEFLELGELEARKQFAAITPRSEDLPEAEVTLPGLDEDGEVVTIYRLGPTLLTGDAIEGASTSLSSTGEWQVLPTFKEGAEGIDLFNAAAALCNSGAPECPALDQGGEGSLGVVLDGVVVTAPNISEASFERDQITISGGSIDQEQAERISLALRYGSLPLELEAQSVETVSATLGEGALRAGIIAGLVGLGLAIVYMVAYYRLLGLVSVAALALASIQLLAIVAWLGETQGLALTLAGVVGIIISIGVNLDSNVVYFEHIKEEVMNGRTVQSAVDRTFPAAWSTIVKADMASLISAVVLYVLTVGPVRGFAFFLGLATVLDLIVSYFFMRPLTIMLGQSALRRRPKALGMSSPTPVGGDA